MKRFHWLVLVLLTALTPTPAWAQYGYTRPATSPFPQPTVSPYLNLLRGGNVAVNYYDLVRPQQQLTTAMQNLQHQVNATSYTAAETQNALLETGHPVLFMNYSHFYGGRFGSPGGAGQGTSPVRSPLSSRKLSGGILR
jgi:hypothetical protein